MATCACEINACVLCEDRIYSGLSKEQVCHIREHLVREMYEPHEVLFREGDEATSLFSLRSGQIKLTTSMPDGRQQILRLVVAGQLLGIETFKAQRYPFTAEALTDVVACKISHNDLRQILELNPAVSLRLIESLSQQLDQAESLIRDLGLKTSLEKVSSFLLSLIPQRGDPGAELPLRLSRREIAEMLGLTEETVSRVMADFARRKIIGSGKGYIRILDRKWLGETAGVRNDSTAAGLRVVAGHS
ncbi:transcriptional regulator [Sulfuricaulis limicola]|uniref:Transcriptional regulator n=1 Tax=Sulfuricaulis limicola TaxID=1620215 RepID=A0A1B4XCM1_9GAMM|nr:Crp/Fnr family transcriptional regulator [Sulfuricaulis limicola]BAV32558.1 transcriptional regulator [Sulfuricaulis limicola]